MVYLTESGGSDGISGTKCSDVVLRVPDVLRIGEEQHRQERGRFRLLYP